MLSGWAKRFSLFLFLGCVCLAPAAQAEPLWSVGLGVDFATGDYGTDTNTDSVRVPLTIYVLPTDRLDLELVVPYIYQSSSTTTVTGGMRFPTGGEGRRRMGTDSGTETSTVTSEETESRDGLGDITLTAGYLLTRGDERFPALRPLLYLKFPTGDEGEGLGTGEIDVGGGLGATIWFGPIFTFLEGRYIWQGSNTDFGLKDYGTVEGEAGYRLSANFLPSVSIWWSSPPADASSDLIEARFTGLYRASEEISIEGYVGTGLSDDTADILAGLSVFYRF